MRLFEFADALYESNNRPCIVVDVQPAYESWIDFDMPLLCEFLAKNKAPKLMFVNAEETYTTEDNVEHDIIPWWEEQFQNADLDLFDNTFDTMTFFDKGYGHFRAWMDQGISDKAIIETIRTMYNQKVNDSRMLFGGEEQDDYIINMTALGVDKEFLADSIHVEWTSLAQLKKFSGAYIMGGGRNECLREVELLMNAFNIKYKRIDQFVYG